MCIHGEVEQVNVINPNQVQKRVQVDSCIAKEIDFLNRNGVITLSSCCGHGSAGRIIEWENGLGKWRGHSDPPKALVANQSLGILHRLGYRPFPYYYADGEHDNVWQVMLKTGCLTLEECINWSAEGELTTELISGDGAPLID